MREECLYIHTRVSMCVYIDEYIYIERENEQLWLESGENVYARPKEGKEAMRGSNYATFELLPDLHF